MQMVLGRVSTATFNKKNGVNVMTVKELIDMLSEFDPDSEVVIGMVQNYGSDFAMEIRGVSYENVYIWQDEDAPCVVITEGSQVGIVNYGDEEDEGFLDKELGHV